MLTLLILAAVVALIAFGPAIATRLSGVILPELGRDAGTWANFIPEVWSRSVLDATETSLVAGSVVNRDYEGEISAGGDTVRINSFGDPTIKNYDRTTDIDAAEELTNAQQVLTIDQEKYYNFAVSDVDKAQMNVELMGKATARAGYRLAKTADSYLIGLLTNGAANALSDVDASGSASSSLVYDALVDLGVALSEDDVPDMERWVIITPATHGKLLKDDRFVSFGTGPNGQVLANGKVGRAAGFDILVSNQLTTDASGHPTIVAGHPMAATFAQQLLETEAYRPERRFSDAVKGLHVYGGKVTRPEFLAKVELTLA